MRIAVLSDIHGNLTALRHVLRRFDELGSFDQYWCLGDLAAFGPRAHDCIALIREQVERHGDKVFKVIGGNTDRYLVTGERFKVAPVTEADNLAAFAQAMRQRDRILNWNLDQLNWEDYEFLHKILGAELRLSVPDYGVVCGFHAIPGDDEAMNFLPDKSAEEAQDALLDREGRLALVGHTHQAMDRELNHWRVINPGSVGLSFSQPGYAEFAVLTFENGHCDAQLYAEPYAVDELIADLNAMGHPEPDWFAQRVKPKN